MNQYFRRLKGLSVFEMLFVVLALSLVVVAATRYFNTQKENAAAQVYGENLYTLGQAVYQYVYNNANNLVTKNTMMNQTTNTQNRDFISITARPTTVADQALYPGYDTKLTITGTDWLIRAKAGLTPQTSNPYLPNNFSLAQSVSSLLVAQPIPDGSGPNTALEGNLSVSTTIYYSKASPGTSPQVAMSYGALYEQKISPSGSTYNLRPDLTQAAMMQASTMFTPYSGPSALTYTYPYLTAGTPAAAIPLATIAPQAQVGTGNTFLLVDGKNTMNGTLAFNSTTSNAGASVTNLNFMNFIAGAAQITGLNNLTMVANGGPPTITMSTQEGLLSWIFNLSFLPSGAGIINNVNTLYFDSNTPANLNVIQNVDKISFRAKWTGNLQGMQLRTGFSCSNSSNNASWCNINGVSSSGSVCYITHIETPNIVEWGSPAPVTPGNSYPGCYVYPTNWGGWQMEVEGSPAQTTTCEAQCIIWGG